MGSHPVVMVTDFGVGRNSDGVVFRAGLAPRHSFLFRAPVSPPLESSVVTDR